MNDKKDFEVLDDAIPEDIMNIVQTQDTLQSEKVEELKELEEKREQKRKKDYDEEFSVFLDFIVPQLPDGWAQWISAPTYYENYNHLIIQIPGLAPIAIKWEKKDDVPVFTELGIPAAWEGGTRNEIDWHWNWGEKLQASQYELAIWHAAKSARIMKGMIEQRQKRLEEQRKLYDRDAEDDKISNERFAAQAQKENEEDELLFKAIKDDRVAVFLMKAFLAIRQERSGFEQQIEGANESLYSMENFWSEKAANLRRQADDAERRASDERIRLENDLSDAEEKLKKVKKGR